MLARRVRTARIIAHAESAARHTAITLGDALHTASLPDRDGRIYAIRSLRLVHVRPDAAPATLALVVEAAVQARITNAVHAASPGAAAAGAVWFDDAAQAVMLLARSLARGIPPSAWYWQLVLPGWKPLPAAGESLRSLLLYVASLDTGEVLTVALLDALVAERSEALLLDALRAEDGRALLDRAPWSAATVAAPSTVPRLARGERTRIAHWARRWPDGDPRTVWLVCARLASHQPACFADRALGQRAVLLITRLCDAEGEEPLPARLPHRRAQDARTTSSPALHVSVQSDHRPATAVADDGTVPAGGVMAGAEPVVCAQDAEGDAPADADERRASPAGATDWSVAAGMLFVVSMLCRLGLDDAVSEDPSLIDAHWPATLLGVVARGLRVPATDPVLRVLNGSVDARPDDAHRSLTARWIRRLRRTSRAWLDQPLRSVVFRTGRVAASRTHIDIVFTLAQVDLALRRAGIDIDPGWVPWLGRVVQFRYVEHQDA